MNSIKDSYLLEKFLISIFFTTLGYIFAITKISDIFTLFDLLRSGFPLLIKELITLDFWKNFPLTPVIITWSIIGISLYFLYFFLNLTYCNITNWLIVKTKFINREDSKEFHIHYLKRYLIHVMVAIFFSLIITSLLGIFFPLAESLRALYFESLRGYVVPNYVYVVSYVLIFLYWYLLTNIFGYLTKSLFQIEKEEAISTEHLQIK